MASDVLGITAAAVCAKNSNMLDSSLRPTCLHRPLRLHMPVMHAEGSKEGWMVL